MPSTEYWINYALRQIRNLYGVNASVVEKDKALTKLGRSDQVNASNRTTLMTLPSGTLNETYLSSNLITHVSSSSGSDTGSMIVEGHTISSGVLTFVVQTVTLAGQTKTALTTPLARCTRLLNNSATDWVGTIYAYQDVAATAGVPGTASAVHCMVRAGQNKSEKGSTSTSYKDYWLITHMHTHVLTKTSGNADVELQVRELGSVFQAEALSAPAVGAPDRLTFEPYIVVPANADVRMSALGSGNLDVAGVLRGILAIDKRYA